MVLAFPLNHNYGSESLLSIIAVQFKRESSMQILSFPLNSKLKLTFTFTFICSLFSMAKLMIDEKPVKFNRKC